MFAKNHLNHDEERHNHFGYVANRISMDAFGVLQAVSSTGLLTSMIFASFSINSTNVYNTTLDKAAKFVIVFPGSHDNVGSYSIPSTPLLCVPGGKVQVNCNADAFMFNLGSNGQSVNISLVTLKSDCFFAIGYIPR